MNGKSKFIVLAFFTGLFLSAYENCSPVLFSAQVNNVNGSPNVPDGGITATNLRAFQPVLAVRGLNCMACHGVIGSPQLPSNVITDFGYQAPYTSHLTPLYTNENLPFSDTSGRTAFNDIDSGWQNLVLNGTLHIPNAPISAADALSGYGLSTGATTLAAILQNGALEALDPAGGGQTMPMTVGITPPTGATALVQDSSITISYPQESEILSLPATTSAIVSTVAVPGVTNSQVSGLVLDSSGKFVRNSGTVTCYGDVVVKGVLLLNNLSLQTDFFGCRLYVSGTVFIQGPVNYVGGANGGVNLQISSARAIIMGFSTWQMGAIQAGSTVETGDPSSVRVLNVSDNNIQTAGGPWARFSADADNEFTISGYENGIPMKTFFDDVVSDAMLIGSELQDAGEPAAIAAAATTPGESLVTETGAYAGRYGGQRVAINYTGLLLNAPQVHSRYCGHFQGVVISDVAMLARNPSGTQTLEQFNYDPVFNTAPAILPALQTVILNVVH